MLFAQIMAYLSMLNYKKCIITVKTVEAMYTFWNYNGLKDSDQY